MGLQNELYVNPDWDINPLTSINGNAKVMSQKVFLEKYPNGKVPRNSKDHGKVFVCRRGCNTRTASYTDEFIWEDVFRGTKDSLQELAKLVKNGTKATRKPRTTRKASPLYDMDEEDSEDDQDHKRTPKKGGRAPGTPKKQRVMSKSVTPSSHRKYVTERSPT